MLLLPKKDLCMKTDSLTLDRNDDNSVTFRKDW